MDAYLNLVLVAHNLLFEKLGLKFNCIKHTEKDNDRPVRNAIGSLRCMGRVLTYFSIGTSVLFCKPTMLYCLSKIKRLRSVKKVQFLYLLIGNSRPRLLIKNHKPSSDVL